MRWFGTEKAKAPEPAPAKPILDLSGPRLRRAFENLVASAENSGGVERYVGVLALKASLFDETLGHGRADSMTEKQFCDIACFIAPVRRRIGPWLEDNRFEFLRRRIGELLAGGVDIATVDERITAFVGAFPNDREHRWTRDLAAEILHFTAPHHIPLMTRWIWDHGVGSGALREVWHADDVDSALIAVDDGIGTHLALREELSGFLKDNGVFRDMPFYVDLFCAHIYAGYINDRGGHYLKPDFCGEQLDSMLHTRRMLGLDAIDTESGRTRLKLIDGSAYVLAEPRQLNS